MTSPTYVTIWKTLPRYSAHIGYHVWVIADLNLQYHKNSNKRPGCLLYFATLKVGAYSSVGTSSKFAPFSIDENTFFLENKR